MTDLPKREGQDDIDASRAPLMDHLVELRARLIKSLIAFFLMFVLCFAFSRQIFQILLGPYAWAAGGWENVKTQFTHALEPLFTQIKIGFFGGLFLGFPIIATQIYKFVAPGPLQERAGRLPALSDRDAVFFILGALVVYFIAMPLLMQFSLSQQMIGGIGQAEIRLDAKIGEYLDLIMQLILAFGVTFQLPVVSRSGPRRHHRQHVPDREAALCDPRRLRDRRHRDNRRTSSPSSRLRSRPCFSTNSPSSQ